MKSSDNFGMCSLLLHASLNFILICPSLKKSHDTVTENKQVCGIEQPHAQPLVTIKDGDSAGVLELEPKEWDSPVTWGGAAQHCSQHGREGQPQQQHQQNTGHEAHGHQLGKHKPLQRMNSGSQN